MPAIAHARSADWELFRRELDSFVPDVILDAHAHLWARAHLPPMAEGHLLAGWDAFRNVEEEVIDLAAYRRYMAELLPGRHVAGGLLLPSAVAAEGNQLTAQNELTAAEAGRELGWSGALLVTPEMDPEYIRGEVRRLHLKGLKCYHVRSGKNPSWEADIPDYLPEAQVHIAHEEKLWIMLHMVKARAVADPSNQRWIRYYCDTYPDMQLILAHAARGFNPYHTMEGLQTLKGLPNLWCDTAAVTEVGACEAIIEILGHDHLLYGSDFPVSHLRGRCVAVGDGFVWLYEDTLDWNTVSFKPLQPVLVGLESLRVLRQAAWHCQLRDSQVEDIFCNNARELLERLA